jgi:voltage-gated potassium channel
VPEQLPTRRGAMRGTRVAGPVRASWWLGPSGIAFLLVLAVLSVGTAGYMIIEGWPAWDSLFMTVTSITTVGYREVHPLSRSGQAFTIVLLLAGVGTVLYALTLGVASVVQSGWAGRWEAVRRARMIDDLHDHFIVCGYGRMGKIIVEEMHRQGAPYLVIDRDPALVHELIAAGGLALAADASSEEVLERAGIRRARALITAVGTDAENVYIIISARLIRPDLYIIGRAESDDAVRKLKRAGADRVFSPYQVGAHQIAQAALRPAVVDFVQLVTSAGELELGIEQVRVTDASPLCGQSLASGNVRQQFGVVVVGIQRTSGRMEFNPAPEAVIQPGDFLIVMGKPDSLKQLELIAGERSASRASLSPS